MPQLPSMRQPSWSCLYNHPPWNPTIRDKNDTDLSGVQFAPATTPSSILYSPLCVCTHPASLLPACKFVLGKKNTRYIHAHIMMTSRSGRPYKRGLSWRNLLQTGPERQGQSGAVDTWDLNVAGRHGQRRRQYRNYCMKGVNYPI